jgi:hypothetical protein
MPTCLGYFDERTQSWKKTQCLRLKGLLDGIGLSRTNHVGSTLRKDADEINEGKELFGLDPSSFLFYSGFDVRYFCILVKKISNSSPAISQIQPV